MNAQEIRAAVQAAIETPPVPLTVPVLGSIHVRYLTGADMEFIASSRERSHKSGRNLALLIADASGARVFDPDSDSDAEFLGKLPYPVVKAITDQANRANGLNDEGAEDAKNG